MPSTKTPYGRDIPRTGIIRRPSKSLPRVRKLVLEDKDYHGADEECHKMQGPFNQNYEPLGDLLLDFEHSSDVTGYRRELDLDSAIATTIYEIDRCRYTREIFASHPSQLIVMRLQSSEKGRLNVRIALEESTPSELRAR